uniref:Uncharacterized protein n=1 Tax=Citrifermentans bremense TaxID=60035 RepID=A0A6S6LV82_9BACT
MVQAEDEQCEEQIDGRFHGRLPWLDAFNLAEILLKATGAGKTPGLAPGVTAEGTATLEK